MTSRARAGFKPPVPGHRAPRRPGAGLWIAGLAIALLLPSAAEAQSSVWAQATPNPFTSGATITINAQVTPGDSPESWCFEWDYCYIVGAEPFLEVSGPNGYSALTSDWNAQWVDSGPGQTMQPATYTVNGGVFWTVCWGFYTCDEVYQYGESGSTQTSATPSAPVVSESVSPTSGSGSLETFTFFYTSATGFSNIHQTWQVIHQYGQYVNSCVVGFYAQPLVFVLWDDSGTGTPNESSAPLGSTAILENSQCRLHMSGVDRVGVGNWLSIVLTIEFKLAYSGPKSVYMYGMNAAGAYSPPHLAGSYTVSGCAYQVTPGSTTVGSSNGNLTFSVVTPSQCPWSAPATSGFMTRTTAGSGSGSGQVSYSYTANSDPGARMTQPVIAGQTVAVNQVGAGESVPGDEVVYYHHDAIGSVRVVSDASGNVVRRHDFLPFGQEWQPSSSADRLLFTAQERDAETGTDYFGARYYDSRVERFSTVDPGFASASLLDPQSFNGYAYARNNPLLFVDPDGRLYELCGLNAPMCGQISDSEFADHLANPDPGIRFDPQPSNNGLARGYIISSSGLAGFYEQLYIDPIYSHRVNGCDPTVPDDCTQSELVDPLVDFSLGTFEGLLNFATWRPLADNGPEPCLVTYFKETAHALNPAVPGLPILAAGAVEFARYSAEYRAYQYARSRPNYLKGKGLTYHNKSKPWVALKARAVQAYGGTFFPAYLATAQAQAWLITFDVGSSGGCK